jgi:hypothetical protein
MARRFHGPLAQRHIVTAQQGQILRAVVPVVRDRLHCGMQFTGMLASLNSVAPVVRDRLHCSGGYSNTTGGVASGVAPVVRDRLHCSNGTWNAASNLYWSLRSSVTGSIAAA